MKRRNIIIMCLVIISVFWFSSFGGKEVSSTERMGAKDQLVFAISAAPEGRFNPLISNTQYDEYVNSLVYSSLLKLNSKIELEPALAKK